MNAEVLQEFLVALGFKVDESGLKKFNLQVGNAEKIVASLAKAVTAMAVTVVAGVVKVSDQFEDLYYASQRLHASVTNIKAYDYAISQVGGTAKGARGALEGIASFMRSNPGGERFIASLGVQTRDANGNLRDTVDIMRDLGVQFRHMPYWVAKARANMLGIDETTLQAMMRDSDKFFSEYRQNVQAVGVDQQAAAEASKNFMQQLRSYWAESGIIFGGALLKMQELATSPYWKQFSGETDKVSQKTNELADAFAGLWEVIGPGVKTVLTVGLHVALQQTANLLDQITAGLKFVVDLAHGNWGAAGQDYVRWAKAQNGLQDAGGGAAAPRASGPRSSPISPAEIAKKTVGLGDQAMAFFQSKGWTRAQAAGIVASLARESSFNAGAIGDHGRAFGLGQWHADRQAAFKRWAGKDIRQSSFAEQLAFVQYELTQGMERRAGGLLKGAGDAASAARLITAMYERPADITGEGNIRARIAQNWFNRPLGGAGGASVAINQKTEIKVYGSDAQATGRAVASEQNNVNGNLVRNTMGAVR